MRKCANTSPYIRRPLVIYDFATAPLWISLYMRKILFSFLSVYIHTNGFQSAEHVINFPSSSVICWSRRRTSALDVLHCHWYRRQICHWCVDTGGAPWLANISVNFRKNSNWPYCYFQGLGGRWFMKKNLKQKISWHCPFKLFTLK